MIALETLTVDLGAAGAWEERGGGYWLEPPSLDVRRMARVLVAQGARFIAITARPEEEGPIRMSYHWDLDGRVLTVDVLVPEGGLPSIAAVCEAADWIEREIHETYAVEFAGRDHEPLLLRPGQPLGVNLRGEDE